MGGNDVLATLGATNVPCLRGQENRKTPRTGQGRFCSNFSNPVDRRGKGEALLACDEREEVTLQVASGARN